MRINERSQRSRPGTAWLGALVMAMFAVLVVSQPAEAQATFAADTDEYANVTFSGEVASIIFENCTNCHTEGGIAPMQFTTYEEIRPWAPIIREKVVNREMPPYAYDTDVGIQNLLADWRLSEDQINTIVAWVDQGAPLGDPAQVPELELPDPDKWNYEEEFGPPDVIIPSTPVDVPASGNDMWHRPYVPTGLTEDRCIRAVQVKPRGTEAKTVVHHANSTFQQMQEDGSFETAGRVTEYAMGKFGERVPDGVCRTAPANAHVLWDIHLYPGGLGSTAPNAVIEDNVVEIGLWLHPEDYEAEYEQDLSLYGVDEAEMVIPPHGTHMTQGFHSWDHPVRIDSFQPHGHLRLRHASLEIFDPATMRTSEVVSMISNWSAQWHHSHIYHPDEAPLLPAGAILIVKQWYDNTAENPNNPDPDLWVDGGSRTADEMDHAWIAVTHLDEEGYQELLEEREAQEEEEDPIAQQE